MFSFRRVCQILFVLTLSVLVAGCGDDRSRRGRRGNGETPGVNNSPGANNTGTNNGSGPVDPNNEPGPTNNGPGPVDPNNEPGPWNNDPGSGDGDFELCEAYCHLAYGCAIDACSLAPGDEVRFSAAKLDCIHGNTSTGHRSCLEDLEGPNAAAFREDLRRFVYRLDSQGNPTTVKNTCESTEYIRCGEFLLLDECNCRPPTNLGAACTTDAHCDGGSLRVQCVPETFENGLPGGYCLAGGCEVPADPEGGQVLRGGACGPNGVCRTSRTSTGRMQGTCYPGCTSGSCRAGYGCQIVGYDPSGVVPQFAQACLPACGQTIGCPDNMRCNALGECEAECNGDLAMLCNNSGGTCEFDESRGREYCVLP